MKRTNIWIGTVVAALTAGGLTGCNKSGSDKAALNAPAPGQPTKQPQKQAPKPPLGVEIVNAFSANKTLRAARISVGTSGDVVTLNGTVPTEADRKAAIAMVLKEAPKAKVVDLLQVGAKPAAKTPAGHR